MRRIGWSGVLAALLAGTAAYLLIRQPVVGVLAAAVGYWFFWRRGRGPGSPSAYDGPVPARPSPTRQDGGIEVVCKQVTAERQEWVSVKTGRLYDVLTPNGLPDAKPGDFARGVTTSTGYKIVTPVADPVKIDVR